MTLLVRADGSRKGQWRRSKLGPKCSKRKASRGDELDWRTPGKYKKPFERPRPEMLSDAYQDLPIGGHVATFVVWRKPK